MTNKTLIKYKSENPSSNECELISISNRRESNNLNDENRNEITKNYFIKRIILVVLLLLFVLVVVVFILNDQTLKKENKREPSNEYKPATFILDFLNQSINPCENFHEFTCGNWISNSLKETDQFTLAIEKSLKDLAEILDEKIFKDDSQSVINFKMFYKSCMNTTESEFFSDKYFLQFMEKKFGSWPMLMNSSSKKVHISLEENVAKLISIRMPLIFRFESIEFNKKMIMKITGTEDFCFMQSYIPKNSEARKAFFKLLKQLNQYFNHNFNEQLNHFDEQMLDMLKLMDLLYFINDKRYSCLSPREKAQPQYFTATELNDKLSGLFDFPLFIEYLNQMSTTTLNKKTKILITTTAFNYLKDLLENLKLVERLDNAFLNLIYFHSLIVLLKPVELFSEPHLHVLFPMKYYQAFLSYDKLINNEVSLKNFHRLSREKNCANSVIESFSYVNSYEQQDLQRFFIRKKFDSKIKNNTKTMLNNLISTATELIDDQNWIDSRTKSDINVKLNSLNIIIGYSDSIDNLLNKSDKENLFNYNLTKHYILNLFQMREKQFEIEFETVENQEIRKKSDFDIFLSSPLFLKEYSTLIFPVIILMEPIYSLKNPLYLNYATIGVYLAHELWHSIEDNLNYLPKVFKGFQCLNNNYQLYLNKSSNKILEHSEMTLEEQIADSFGLTVALKAYLKQISLKDDYSDNFLPDLKYSKEQLFFIRYAMSYCRKVDSKRKALEYFHPIHEYRTFQTSLIPEFQAYFRCKFIQLHILATLSCRPSEIGPFYTFVKKRPTQPKV